MGTWNTILPSCELLCRWKLPALKKTSFHFLRIYSQEWIAGLYSRFLRNSYTVFVCLFVFQLLYQFTFPPTVCMALTSPHPHHHLKKDWVFGFPTIPHRIPSSHQEARQSSASTWQAPSETTEQFPSVSTKST